MQNNITNLEISNFKSIKNIKMDCKRINVLIGRPNVGKSNILEALSLFIAPYNGRKPFLKDYIRYEKISNLFYDDDRKNQVIVKTDIGSVALRFHMNGINAYDFIVVPNAETLDLMNGPDTGSTLDDKISFFQNLHLQGNFSGPIFPFYGSIDDNFYLNSLATTFELSYRTPLKNYKFKTLTEHKNHFASFLAPPYGDNLFTVLEGNPELYNEIAAFFNKYDLDLVLKVKEEEIVVQKQVNRRVFHTPYFLSADTLQRIIFYLAAIKTNTNSILILEEPESHSFPPYISKISEAVIESKDNQFFIATHSPYLLTPFITQCPLNEVAIFIVDYKDFQTTVRALTDDEVQNLIDSEADLFTNLQAFQE